MAKLGKLTEEQVELMAKVRGEWINHFNRLSFDEEKCRKLIERLYEIAKQKKPIVVILDSPLALQIACNQNKKSQVRSQVRSQVISQVMSQVISQVMSQKNLKYFYEGYYGRCDDLVWISFYDYFNRIGIHHHELFLELKELFKCGIFTSIMQEGICYVSKPPMFLKRDERENMHCTNDYAIYFKDGFGLHYLYGVYFSPEDFEKYVKGKKAVGKEIMRVKNTEQKAALIKLYGYDKIISELKNLKIIDVFEKKSLITGRNTKCELMEFDMDDIKAKVLKVEDHSNHKITFLGIPNDKNINTCLKALAWTFDVKPGDYYKLVKMES